MKPRTLSVLFRICLGLVWVLWIPGCGRKPDPAAAATTFFEHIGNAQFREAYESASYLFQARQTPKSFELTMQETGIDGFSSATWQPVQIHGKLANLEGDLVLKSGAKLEVDLEMTQESGGWRVFSIKRRQDPHEGFGGNLFALVSMGGALTPAVDRPIPDDKAVRKLVIDTLLEFNGAIQEKSFGKFYKGVSGVWQRQLTVGQLDRAFAKFIEKDVHLDAILKSQAEFHPAPFINSEGLLMVSGQYPGKPSKVTFALKYIYELPRWRLFGIDVNLVKAD